MPNELLDLDQVENYPILIEYPNGAQDIITCQYDIPDDCCFAVIKTKFVLNGRVIIESCQTKQ